MLQNVGPQRAFPGRTAQLTVDFLPRESTRSSWVAFTINPATVDDIEAHVLGYQQP